MRIGLPNGEDPVAYVMTKVGSPRLVAARNQAWYAQYLNDSTLSPREREGIRMRTAHLMGCGRCLEYRPCLQDTPVDPPELARDIALFTDDPIPEDFYQNVLDRDGWPGYSDRERLAIEFCERFCFDHIDLARDDAFWVRLDANFTELELADMNHLVAFWDAGVKMYHVLAGADLDVCMLPAWGDGPRAITDEGALVPW